MKIGIITDETDGPPVGMGNVILNFVDKLLDIDKTNDYYLIHRKKEKYKIYSKTKELIIPYNYKFPFSTIRNFIKLPYRLRKEKFDIIHHPCNVGPFVFRSLLPGKKNIQTIHDVIPLIIPRAYEKTVRFAYKYFLPRVIKNVDKLIADSYASKKDIIKHYKVQKEKIKVIYVAANEKFRVMNKQKSREIIMKKFNIDFPYLLYVGSLEPKKNVPFLIKVFGQLKKRGIPHKLVLVGKRGWYFQDILNTIEKLGLKKEVILLGYVRSVYYSDELPSLYNCADLFVFPSLYEGFGLPPIEAMSCGCPVITSNRGSLPEVVGNGGIILSKFSIKEYADKMAMVLKSNRERRSLVKKGFKNSKRFTWEKHAKKVLEAYET